MQQIMMQQQQQQQQEEAEEGEEEAQLSKKMICRYGRGCTHIHDIVHREKFWHPAVPRLSAEEIEHRHICNECGMAFDSLTDLQAHLIRKTAWSNQSLCGCRVSLLLDNKQWYEGIVLRFEKGRHLVQIRTLDDQYGERRWLHMRKTAFYVVELPDYLVNEVKEPEDPSGLGDLDEEPWTYTEEISLEYAYAQWMLYKLYGNQIQETGHKTKGHVCLTEEDKELAKLQKGSLLYGELLPRGVNKALDSCHLDGRNAKVLYDLGMGTGKVAIQAFLQFRNLQYVHGVELSFGRYLAAETALIRLAIMNPHAFELRRIPGKSVCLIERIGIQPQYVGNSDAKQQEEEEVSPCTVFDPTDLNNVRVLHLAHGDMLQTSNMELVDIIMLETDVPSELHKDLCRLLAKTKEGCRALTYLDLNTLWSSHMMPFRQLDNNRYLTDRFPTSWSVQRGHHFFMWTNARSPLNPFRRNSFSASPNHGRFAQRCAAFLSRLFPSKNRSRAKYKPADCIIPFAGNPETSIVLSPAETQSDLKTDKLLQVIAGVISTHPLCEKPAQLIAADASKLPVERRISAITWPDDSWDDDSRDGDRHDCVPTVVDQGGHTTKPTRDLVLDVPDDCKCGNPQKHDPHAHHTVPASPAMDEPNCSIS